MGIQCRYYPQRYPKVDEVVMVVVKSIAELGAYVELLEYKNIEGMILLSELSRRRIRSMNKLIRIDTIEPVVVIRVDEEKGYIDLSKRRVGKEDIVKCTERYSKAKAVNSILRHIGELLDYTEDEQLEDLYKRTAWSLEEKYKFKLSAFDIFKEAVTDDSILVECGLDEECRKVLISQLQLKLQPQAVKIRADIECNCYEYDGINAIKQALREGLALSTDEMPIKINIISSPLYVVTINTTEASEGVKLLERALEKINETIKGYGGNLKITMAPKVVTHVEDTDLAKLMQNAEDAMMEKDGDDDESVSEDSDAE